MIVRYLTDHRGWGKDSHVGGHIIFLWGGAGISSPVKFKKEKTKIKWNSLVIAKGNPKLLSLITASPVKPTIHYLRTWRVGDKIIFSPNKILLAKTRQTCFHTLFVVCRQFSHGRRFFFNEKILCVRRRDCYPNANPACSVRQKTCSQNMVNAFYTLFAVRRFFRRFAPISLLFANSV